MCVETELSGIPLFDFCHVFKPSSLRQTPPRKRSKCPPRNIFGRRTLYIAGFGKGVFRSNDDGRTWKLKNQGLGGNLNAWRLVLMPDRSLYLLVARGLENGQEVDGALYKSTDGAEHWQRVALPAGTNAPNDLVFDPSNARLMYLACWPKTIKGAERFGGLYVTED